MQSVMFLYFCVFFDSLNAWKLLLDEIGQLWVVVVVLTAVYSTRPPEELTEADLRKRLAKDEFRASKAENVRTLYGIGR